MKRSLFGASAVVAAVAFAAVALAAAGYVLRQKDDGSVCFTSTGTVNYDAACLSGSGDFTLSPRPDNNDGADFANYVGIPKLATWSTGAGVNGTTNTIAATVYIDETPAGEWVGTTNVTDSTATDHFRVGAAALKLAVVDAAVAGNGADNTLAGGDQDWTSDESFGVWQYCDVPLVAGNWVLEITDSGAGATTVNFPAIAANTWTWQEIDVSGVANASKDVVQSLAFDLSTAGAAVGAFNCWFDFGAKWDAADEEALGNDVLEGGVFQALAIATAAATANTVTVLTQNTDYFIHYETGNDFFVAITDQSAASIFGLAALE